MNKWIALGAACWLAGCASAPRPAAEVAATPAGCVNQSGSLIRAPKGECTAFGHSYSSADIARTGETTVGGVLENLDPTISIHR
jgi:hypothetical protein